MPFLFEQLGDETELLLPENLLLTDSVVAKLVQSIPEGDWQQIEIIGWLYQFYISEKKEQVIGKVVKSEDIPAATQLFTPNWIVKYMVQNSLGAQWLATYRDSPLKAQMAYYIEPAEQTDEVNAQLAAMTPTSLNPEELTLIDPASGSGHILVEAYDLFKAIYLERGYRQRDVAKLILEKNLFGLDIDERAAQLTGFALMMKGRADDRQLFERSVKLNVMALVDSAGFDPERLAQGVKLADYGLKLGDLTELKELFEHATTFGSLIQVPDALTQKLPALKRLSEVSSQDLFVAVTLKQLGPLVRQAELLAAKYDAVVANPPYMGSKMMNPLVKKFTADCFAVAKKDLFSCFILRGYTLAKTAGDIALITMQSWMFLSSFQQMRERMLSEKTMITMAHLGARAFGSISGEVVQTTSFVLRNCATLGYRATYFRLLDGGEHEKRASLLNGEGRFSSTTQEDFESLPGSPLAYWVSERVRGVFAQSVLLSEIATPRQGCATSDNGRFLRHWHEVDRSNLGLGLASRDAAEASGKMWFPYNKGGSYRKWAGNYDHVVNWRSDGAEIKEAVATKYPYLNGNVDYVVKNRDCYFLRCASWSKISGGGFALRLYEAGFVFDVSGCSIFTESAEELYLLLGSMNSPVMSGALNSLSPTLNYEVGQVGAFPIAKSLLKRCDYARSVQRLVAMAKTDWDERERSWDFQSLPILPGIGGPTTNLEACYAAWVTENRDTIAEMKRLEEENNRLFIDAYGLRDELTPDVPIEQITLTVNPAYRYGGEIIEEEQWTRFREGTMAELVSYAIGCMMGRYSLDAPGLIYAHSGNVGFDASRYTRFPADADGIVPVTEELWFEDDAALRVRDFLLAVWDKDSLEQNMAFLADNLGRKASESPEQAIRRYLADKFFKDHLQTYKKRPIYWLFSSGKQGAFQALVYL
ncbi:MAG: BREX-1 system adenine-specific DNA-methyltransferase PglX, partial [Pseudomonadota bacterium]